MLYIERVYLEHVYERYPALNYIALFEIEIYGLYQNKQYHHWTEDNN